MNKKILGLFLGLLLTSGARVKALDAHCSPENVRSALLMFQLASPSQVAALSDTELVGFIKNMRKCSLYGAFNEILGCVNEKGFLFGGSFPVYAYEAARDCLLIAKSKSDLDIPFGLELTDKSILEAGLSKFSSLKKSREKTESDTIHEIANVVSGLVEEISNVTEQGNEGTDSEAQDTSTVVGQAATEEVASSNEKDAADGCGRSLTAEDILATMQYLFAIK